MKTLKNHFALLFFLALLGGYHGHNAWVGRFYHSSEQWTRSKIELGFRSQVATLFLPSRRADEQAVGTSQQAVFQPIQKDILRFLPVDPSAGVIAQCGYGLRYFLGQIRSDILIGNATPLQSFFWRDEVYLQYPKAAQLLREKFGEPVQHLAIELETKGVEAVILPIPTHFSVQRAGWTGALPGVTPWSATPNETEDALTAYEGFASFDRKRNVNFLKVIRQHQSTHRDDLVYGAGESHWASLGIALGAREIIRNLRDRGLVEEAPQLQLEEIGAPSPDLDFLNHLILPRAMTENLERFRWAEPLYQLTASLKRRPGRLVIAGTSFAARYQGTRFSLASQLERALGREVVDFSKERYWSTGSFERMKTEKFNLRRGDFLIWEIPIKSTSVPKNYELPKVEETASVG